MRRRTGPSDRGGGDIVSCSPSFALRLNPIFASITRDTSYPASLIRWMHSFILGESLNVSLMDSPSPFMRRFISASDIPFLPGLSSCRAGWRKFRIAPTNHLKKLEILCQGEPLMIPYSQDHAMIPSFLGLGQPQTFLPVITPCLAPCFSDCLDDGINSRGVDEQGGATGRRRTPYLLPGLTRGFDSAFDGTSATAC
jgi:hypothetical protein